MDFTPFLTNFQMLEDMTNNVQQLLLPLLGGNPFFANIYRLVPFKFSLFIFALLGFRWVVARGISLTKSHFTASITLGSEDEIYQIVLRWLGSKSLRSRHLRARAVYRRWDEEWYPDTTSKGKHVSFRDNGKIQLLPVENGSAIVWDGWQPFHIYIRDGNMPPGASGIIISCLGRSPSPVLNLLHRLREVHCDPQKVSIMRQVTINGRLGWGRSEVPGRNMETVHLPNKTKNGVLNDINNYLLGRIWYKKREIPYRRGYMFHGPPGTGKTSFALAIADKFGLPIYIFNLAETPPNEFGRLFRLLPTHSIVLLEDIDSVHFPGDGGIDSRETRNDSNKISLSDLLNTLDGVDSPTGHVLIATANNPNSLNEALTRPGRFDQEVEFLPATEPQVSELAQRIYQCSVDEAKMLAKMIPANLSMSTIQEFFIRHTCIPGSDEVENWNWEKVAGWEHEGSTLRDE